MLRSVLVLCSSALVASAPEAQVSVRLVAANDWSVTLGGTTQSVPAGTDVTAGSSLSLIGNTCGPVTNSVSTTLACTTAPSENACAFESSITALATCPPVPTVSRAVLHAVLTAPSPQQVTLTVSVDGPIILTGQSATIRILGTPYSLTTQPFTGTIADTVTVAVDSVGTTVELDVLTAGTSTVSASIAFDPSIVEPLPTVTATSVRPSCGPIMVAFVTPTSPFGANIATVDLRAFNAPTSQAPFFVLGTQSLATPIPPTGCELLTDILAAVPTTVNPAGFATLEIPIALATGISDVRFQFLVGQVGVGGVAEWQTSNAIRVQIL